MEYTPSSCLLALISSNGQSCQYYPAIRLFFLGQPEENMDEEATVGFHIWTTPAWVINAMIDVPKFS
jgi:hypothetical protein